MTFLSSLVDALAPPLCCLCREPAEGLPWLCEPCAGRLELWSGPRCLRCGAPRPLPAPVCARCPSHWPRHLGGVRAAALHGETVRELLHALKRRENLAAARPLGTIVAAAARDLGVHPRDVLVPVPLHPRERRRRGLCPATEIARVAGRRLRLPVRARWLRRIRDTPDSGLSSAAGRLRAVRGAFRAHPRVRGRRVLLVDGVMGTGAAIGSCARALRRRGAAAVRAVTAARWFPA